MTDPENIDDRAIIDGFRAYAERSERTAVGIVPHVAAKAWLELTRRL